jgi:hypothetical protein
LKPLPKPKRRDCTPGITPPACQYDTPGMELDAIGCQAAPDTKYVFVEGSGWQLAEPTPERPIERPTKVEYVAAFAAAGPEPKFVAETRQIVQTQRSIYRDTIQRQPYRVRSLINSFPIDDFLATYSGDLVGLRVALFRVVYYANHQQIRAYLSKRVQ